jgi:hypothetical protein
MLLCSDRSVTQAGFQFLLSDTYHQMWRLLREYISTAERASGESTPLHPLPRDFAIYITLYPKRLKLSPPLHETQIICIHFGRLLHDSLSIIFLLVSSLFCK